MKTKKAKTIDIESAEARCVAHAKDIVGQIAAGKVPVPKIRRSRRVSKSAEGSDICAQALRFLNTPGVE